MSTKPQDKFDEAIQTKKPVTVLIKVPICKIWGWIKNKMSKNGGMAILLLTLTLLFYGCYAKGLSVFDDQHPDKWKCVAVIYFHMTEKGTHDFERMVTMDCEYHPF